MTASGFCDAGRTTTVLPIASAGPSLPAMFTIGKLYGVMHATAPTGWRRAIAPMSPPGASAVCGISIGGSGIIVATRARARVRVEAHRACGTCICLPTVAVQPVSAITSGNRSSKCSFIASAVFCSSSARASGAVCDHAGNASCAARAASSACATDASGATPTTSSVAGLTTS